MKDVTAAIIIQNNKVLIAQRAPSDALAGMWELPGGKIEPGESPQQCLKREIREELEVEIDVLDFFGESIHRYDHGEIRLLAYFCRWTGGDFALKVHSRIEWVGSDELDRFDFAPADIPLAEELKAIIDVL
jgi:8-oxo-dGTP diphosphatase